MYGQGEKEKGIGDIGIFVSVTVLLYVLGKFPSASSRDLDRTTPQKLQHTYSQLSIMLGLEQGDFSTLNSQPAPYHPPQMEVAPTLSGPDRRQSRKPRRVPIHKFKDGGSRSAHIHPIVPNNTVGGSDILQTTVPDRTCEILLLAKEGETERSPCDVALQWDHGWLYQHFGEHQAKGELDFSLSGCPFTLLPGAKPCRTRKGHPVKLSVYTRHVELQHFVNVPRFACDYCDQTFSRPDQVPRHWKEPDSTCGPDKVTVNEHSSVWPQVLTETQWSHEQ